MSLPKNETSLNDDSLSRWLFDPFPELFNSWFMIVGYSLEGLGFKKINPSCGSEARAREDS